MLLAALPDRRATQDPHGPAIADPRSSLTNAAFLDAVRTVAGALAEAGIRRGDVVALRLRNRTELVTTLFAAWRIGATVLPMNPGLTAPETEHQLTDSGARLVVDETGFEAGPGRDAPRALPAEVALLIYTSGTTGTPKGVMLGHDNLDAMTAALLDALALGPEDRCLLVLPLFHVNGIVISVLTTLLAGGSVHIAERFEAATFLELVERERPTFFSAVPTIYALLAAQPPNGADVSSVRFGICGAAPASSELLARVEARFGFSLIEGYGLSEGTCATALNPVAGRRKAGTVGLPLPGQDVRIDGPDDVGEILVRGPNVMRGYLGLPEATAHTVVDGWLHTGDTGRLDEDGYLVLVGRTKDMIIRGGENIYPKEIEDVLSADPAVLEAAVIGVPDETWGEVVVAFVAPAPGEEVDVSALHARCAGSLAGFKRPIRIEVLDELPKNAVGKIDKLVLR